MMAEIDRIGEEVIVSRYVSGSEIARTFTWLLRRELWEHRALIVAPLAAAAFSILVYLIRLLTSDVTAGPGDAAVPVGYDLLTSPYAASSGVIVVTALIVGMLYSLDALKAERLDRSILFWKSLPVSDRLTVVAKAAMPMMFLPAFAMVVAASTHLAMFAAQFVVWEVRGLSGLALWGEVDLPSLWSALLYGVPFMAFWNAPFYAWLLMVSAWARRVAVLWAFAPLAAALAIEHTVLHKSVFHWMVERRLTGGIIEPYTHARSSGHDSAIVWISSTAQFDPARLYMLPGLWIGVLLAAAALYVAARLRRFRAPL